MPAAPVREIDVMHLGNDRVIAAHEVDGAVVDPGPESCVERLLEGMDGREPRCLLLTHIHLDHAGASGALVRRFPGLRVYVHEVGAPHLEDPAKLLKSAGRLYGDRMEELWGEVVPVPEANIATLRGGESIEGFRVEYTPGHASHHVSYLHEATGDAFVGDVAGVRIPPSGATMAPTPPPDIDLEAWERSLELVAAWRSERLRLTHFGAVDDPPAQLAALRESLLRSAERARAEDCERFVAETEQEIAAAGDDEVALRFVQAAPPDQLWMGLNRYWQKAADSSAASS